jgi:hypothetical protein
MTTHFKLAEHAQLIIFCPVAWKKWVHENVSFRSVYDGQLRLCMSLLCGVVFCDMSMRLYAHSVESWTKMNLKFVGICCFYKNVLFKYLQNNERAQV